MHSYILIFHIISVIAWYAVLFYLPRLFVYHAENNENKEFLQVIKIMEYKLYKYIGIPSFWATVGSGVAMIINTPEFLEGWLYAKITLVTLLGIYFFHLGSLRERLENDSCSKSGKFFRAYNEVPTLILIGVVILVILKPF
jgi:putative membrane protein